MRSMRRWRTGSWLVLIAAFALGLLGWKWLLKASVPIIGFWLALMALYGFLLFQLFYPLLAPATEGEQDDLRRAFTYFLFGRLQALGAVDAGQPRNPSEPRAGPGLWLLDARSALAIECEGRLTRIAGPGLVWISEREQVTAFVDLRPQVFPRADASPLQIRTQDGILLDLELRTAVSFLAQRIPHELSRRSPYFDPPDSIRWVITQAWQAARVDEDRVLQWFELPHEMARRELAIRMGNWLFDQLFLFDQQGYGGKPPATPLARLAERIRATLHRDLIRMGIRLNRLRVTLKKVPEEALRQRVEVWRSQWAARLARWIGLAESEMLMEYARARHASQMEMLQAINEVLAAYPEVPPDVILLHFLETLDATVRQSGSALPEELRQLWDYLRGKESGAP